MAHLRACSKCGMMMMMFSDGLTVNQLPSENPPDVCWMCQSTSNKPDTSLPENNLSELWKLCVMKVEIGQRVDLHGQKIIDLIHRVWRAEAKNMELEKEIKMLRDGLENFLDIPQGCQCPNNGGGDCDWCQNADWIKRNTLIKKGGD